MKLTIEQAKKRMEENGGSLYLRGTGITSLPDGLTVGGSLYLRGTCITSLPDGLTVGGSLDLSGTGITSLPDGLTVGGSLDLSGTGITSLPDGLTVGGSLYLRGTGITSLPDGLTVGGSLYLRGTCITSLPDGLTVGGSLDLSGTGITSLPDGLTVGGLLYLRGTGITSLPDGLTVGGWIEPSDIGITDTNKVKRLSEGDYSPGKYLYCDGILTHVKHKKTMGDYTFYLGKIPGMNVVSDGTNYAHCKNFHQGRDDLLFKAAEDRGAVQYKGLPLDDPHPLSECKTMYRVITGACQAGTEAFVNSIHNLKESYTIREMIELTRGQYNATAFEKFFEEDG